MTGTKRAPKEGIYSVQLTDFSWLCSRPSFSRRSYIHASGRQSPCRASCERRGKRSGESKSACGKRLAVCCLALGVGVLPVQSLDGEGEEGGSDCLITKLPWVCLQTKLLRPAQLGKEEGTSDEEYKEYTANFTKQHVGTYIYTCNSFFPCSFFSFSHCLSFFLVFSLSL